MTALLIGSVLAAAVISVLVYRYVIRAIDEGRPGWGDPRERGVYCPHAKGELGDPGEPGEEGPP